MPSATSSILRKAKKKKNEKFNILTAPTHEAYETNLAKTNANFFALGHDQFRGWNPQYRDVPYNYVLFDKRKGRQQIPPDIDFDFVLSQNKFGQFQVLSEIARELHLPLISLEHTLPFPGWNNQQLHEIKKMKGNLNVFISEYSVDKWDFDLNDSSVRIVHHGINTDTFVNRKQERKNVLLSIVNDWVNRDWCCNFNGWARITNELPVEVYGDTPGLSRATQSVDELVDIYNSCSIFVNTSTISPVPTALMEAMSAGCAIVSTATCMIPSIIENGKNGLISNDEQELRNFCLHLLNEPEYARELGENARKTIEDRFSDKLFVKNWNNVFEEASKIIYKG